MLKYYLELSCFYNIHSHLSASNIGPIYYLALVLGKRAFWPPFVVWELDWAYIHNIVIQPWDSSSKLVSVLAHALPCNPSLSQRKRRFSGLLAWLPHLFACQKMCHEYNRVYIIQYSSPARVWAQTFEATLLLEQKLIKFLSFSRVYRVPVKPLRQVRVTTTNETI